MVQTMLAQPCRPFKAWPLCSSLTISSNRRASGTLVMSLANWAMGALVRRQSEAQLGGKTAPPAAFEPDLLGSAERVSNHANQAALILDAMVVVQH